MTGANMTIIRYDLKTMSIEVSLQRVLFSIWLVDGIGRPAGRS